MTITRTGQFDLSKGCVGAQDVGPRIEGTRSPDPTKLEMGETAFRVKSGQRYAGFLARNIGNGVIYAAEPVSGLTVEDISAVNVYRFLEVAAGGALSDSVIRQIALNGAERGFARIRGASKNLLLEDIVADGMNQWGDPFPIGVHIEAGEDITLRRCLMKNMTTPDVPGKYRQGDGYCTEGDARRISFINTIAEGCTDAGYDMKAEGLSMDGAMALRCKRSFRLWRDATLRRIRSEDATGAHICLHGTGPRTIRIERLEISSTTKAQLFLFEASGGAKVSIGSYDIRVPPGTPLGLTPGNAIDWGPQGRPAL